MISPAGAGLAGYGYETSFFLEEPDGGAKIDNPQFGWRFFPRTVSRMPDPGSRAVGRGGR
ncbi:MAG: hypothetical protein AB1726_03565 [Planctomycetota bacterium]